MGSRPHNPGDSQNGPWRSWPKGPPLPPSVYEDIPGLPPFEPDAVEYMPGGLEIAWCWFRGLFHWRSDDRAA
jgi:hypothetical protein